MTCPMHSKPSMIAQQVAERRLILLPLVGALFSCASDVLDQDPLTGGHEGLTRVETERREPNGPTGEISPDDGSPLLVTQAITIVFDEEMDPSALTLGGDLAEDNPAAIWSSTVYRNDTVRLMPRNGWRRGNDRLLTVRGVNREGEPSDTVVTSFCFFLGFIYVDAAHTGIELGTQIRPYNTIQEGIDASSPGWGVLVTGGLYSADFGSTGFPVVTLADDVSLFGGFNPNDWDVRDPHLYVSEIRDLSTTGFGRAVYGSGISDNTVIDGFTIVGGQSETSVAIFNESHSSPIIRHNRIDGGQPNHPTASSLRSYGILNEGASSPVIEDNEIHGGRPTSAVATDLRSFGILNRGAASPVIGRNNIFGGEPSVTNNTATTAVGAVSYGILNETLDTAASIRENQIHGGRPFAFGMHHRAAVSSYGIRSYSTSSPSIAGNHIFGGNPRAESSAVDQLAYSRSAGVAIVGGTTLTIVHNRITGGHPRSKSNAYWAEGFSYALLLSSTQTLTISRNRLRGGSAECYSDGTIANCYTHAIYYGSELQDTVFAPTLVIKENGISGGTAQADAPNAGWAYGHTHGMSFRAVNRSTSSAILAQTTMNVTIINNLIDGGDAVAPTSSSSRGIHTNGSSRFTGDGTSSVIYNMSVRNNTVDGGRGHTASYVYSSLPRAEAGCTTLISPSIENNIFFSTASSSAYCYGIYERPETGDGISINDPLTVRNNTFFVWTNACNWWAPYFDEGSTVLPDIGSMEALTDMTAQNNLDLDPMLNMGSIGRWRLTAQSPIAVTEGGLNGANEGWSFTTDITGKSRTPLDTSPTGWSMGAYEY